jgi:exopolysaccharide biosynthesis protein
MKKISLFILSFVLVFSFFAKISLSAASSDYKEASEAETKNVFGSMTANTQRIETINNGTQDTSSTKYFWNNHTVHWVDFDPSNDVKVVTYSGSNQDKWKQMTTRQAAADWEKHNPGWIVVAGINGDFFENSGATTYQPTNNFMQGGDMYRAEKSSASNRFTIGWKEDGSVIVGDPAVSSDIYLRIYDDNKEEIVQNVKINKVNTNPSASGITLYTKDAKSTYDLTGYTVYDCEYEICRISSGGYVFVKGTVLETVTLGAGSVPGDNHFYLASKDGSLDGVISSGDYIKCEYVYEGAWSNVQNSVGYIDQVLANGVPQHRESTDAFAYTSHPRTLIGFREDGTTVFMVIEGRGKPADYQVGVSHYESGQLLQAQGCVNGYNLDGGGSSTLIVRNNHGGFDVLNDPSDGSERSDGNHCLVVMRDPGFIFSGIDSTYDNAVVDLRVVNQDYFNTLSNIKVTLNGVTKDYVDGGVSFDNVEMSTTYKVEVTYDSPSTYDESVLTNKKYVNYLTTPEYEYPEHGLYVKGKTDSSITIAKDTTLATASQIQDVIVHIGNNTFNLGNNAEIECKDLYQDVEYEVYYEYTVVAPNGDKFNLTSEVIKVKTNAFKVPSIVSFAEARKGNTTLSISYEYQDIDRVVTKAYVLVNGEVAKEVSVKSGSVSLTGLDFEANEYSIQLVIEYTDEDGNTIEVKSEVLEYLHEVVTPEPTPEKKKCGKKSAELIIAVLASASVAGLFLRKRD